MNTVIEKNDGDLLNGIRELCGYVQNGSDTAVTIFQDDATRTWHVKVGEKTYWSNSFKGVIHEAMAGEA